MFERKCNRLYTSQGICYTYTSNVQGMFWGEPNLASTAMLEAHSHLDIKGLHWVWLHGLPTFARSDLHLINSVQTVKLLTCSFSNETFATVGCTRLWWRSDLYARACVSKYKGNIPMMRSIKRRLYTEYIRHVGTHWSMQTFLLVGLTPITDNVVIV